MIIKYISFKKTTVKGQINGKKPLKQLRGDR